MKRLTVSLTAIVCGVGWLLLLVATGFNPAVTGTGVMAALLLNPAVHR